MQLIFQAKICKKRNSGLRQGFTLLELMIVLGIVTGVVMLALPRMGGQNNQLRQTMRRLTAITRELQTTAKLQGAVYRLVIDMGSEKTDKHKFWIEKGSNKTILTPQEMEAFDEKDKDEAPPSTFSTDTQLLKSPMELPGDLRFEDVELRRKDKPISQGKAYIHFFPQGLAEEAVIHLRASAKLRWTMSIHPLTGKSETMDEYISLKDLTQ
jgi:prepilin-type N-terminal cleavage/methylation domain-containing protein